MSDIQRYRNLADRAVLFSLLAKGASVIALAATLAAFLHNEFAWMGIALLMTINAMAAAWMFIREADYCDEIACLLELDWVRRNQAQ
jgi:DNA-binding MarR family transcriptional regulator